MEMSSVLFTLNVIRKTITTSCAAYKFIISEAFIDELSSFLARITELECESAIQALRDSVYSQDKRREIEIAISHLRLAIEKTESYLMKIKIGSMIAVCYKLLGEDELMNLYKEKAIHAFEQWLDRDLEILKSAKRGMESSNLLIAGISVAVRFSKTSLIPATSGLSMESKLIQVGLNPVSIKESCGYDWVPNPYGPRIHSTSQGDRDENFILAAKKNFRESMDEYYSSF